MLSLATGGEPLLGQKVTKNISVYPKGLGGDKPAWVAFDRQVEPGIIQDIITLKFYLFDQVLRFYAYFQEAVHEKAEEQYRIRHCIILFYLEDDTIQVNEPRQENSGIPQGRTSYVVLNTNTAVLLLVFRANLVTSLARHITE